MWVLNEDGEFIMLDDNVGRKQIIKLEEKSKKNVNLNVGREVGQEEDNVLELNSLSKPGNTFDSTALGAEEVNVFSEDKLALVNSFPPKLSSFTCSTCRDLVGGGGKKSSAKTKSKSKKKEKQKSGKAKSSTKSSKNKNKKSCSKKKPVKKVKNKKPAAKKQSKKCKTKK